MWTVGRLGVRQMLTAEHCDGLGTDPELNCLPEGEFLYVQGPFEVIPPRGR